MSVESAERYEALVVISNAIELGCNVIQDIAGNDIADGFGGKPIDRSVLSDTLAAKVASYLRNPEGA